MDKTRYCKECFERQIKIDELKKKENEKLIEGLGVANKYHQTLQEIKKIAEQSNIDCIYRISVIRAILTSGGRMNNFEKIKAMNIDEFSEFITGNCCLYCPYDINTCEDKDCAEGIKQWLQAESEG